MFRSKTPPRLAIIGLGYVGLPLAIEFAKKFSVLGFDINEKRINELKIGMDSTNEASLDDLLYVLSLHSRNSDSGLLLSSEISELNECSVFIVTVPTPIDEFKTPDLGPLLAATRMIGQVLKKDDIVIYESTVYPGCTEEECVAVLEISSNLKYNVDFFCGYSPERINPGDKVNTLTRIVKVTSGSTDEVAEFVDNLYSSIIEVGTHKAPSIKVAEASKAIENAQRDINISFVNELALIFDKMGIDTNDVLSAASTKWNFLSFKPGLVGGHCIGVDPYYLAYKAQSLGYNPEVILSGRRVNERMGLHIANKLLKLMISKGSKIKSGIVLVLGVTFKENCADIRNSRVIDIVTELQQFGLILHVYDPHADSREVFEEYAITLIDRPKTKFYDGIVLAVAHKEFASLNIPSLKKNEKSVVFDVKGFFDREVADSRL